MSKFNFSYNYKYNPNKKRLSKYTIKQMLNDYHSGLTDYIYAVLHPETVVGSADAPKAPNYVPTPTSNITFREAFDITPDSNGNFELYWTPNFLCSATAQFERFSDAQVAADHPYYARAYVGLYDETYSTYVWKPQKAYMPEVDFKKYRLVSAGIKITYKGPTINRAGVISSCLTYRSIPILFFGEGYANGEVIGCNNQTLQNTGEMEYLDTSTIQNGMWGRVSNIQKNNTVFSVAVPTDPSDFIFEDNAFYYAAANAGYHVNVSTLTWTQGDQSVLASKVGTQYPEDGTPCAYIFKGDDLSEGKLYVEMFYNFEIIPTETSAPVFRPRPQNMNKEDIDKAFNEISAILSESSGVGNVSKQDISNRLGSSIKSLESLGDGINSMELKRGRSKSFTNKASQGIKKIYNKIKNTAKNITNKLTDFKLPNTYKPKIQNRGPSWNKIGKAVSTASALASFLNSIKNI